MTNRVPQRASLGIRLGSELDPEALVYGPVGGARRA